jgi:hypothetical protein
MLVREARWIGTTLLKMSSEMGGISLLNLGSSTGEFRSQSQPYIDQRIFAPLKLDPRNSVVHCDLKADVGVDVSVDITDESCLPILAELHSDTVLVSNLLEHVEDINLTVNNIEALVPPSGNLILTGPLIFPYHPDPIDNMFRPTRDEVQDLFKDFEIKDWFEARHTNICTATTTSVFSRVRGSTFLIRGQLQGKGSWKPVSAWCAHLEKK